MLTNASTGGVFLFDFIADNNGRSISTTILPGTPQTIHVSNDLTRALVYDDSQHVVSVIDTTQEKDLFDLQISGRTESLVITSDAKLAFAAVPTFPETSAPPGALLTLDLVNGFVRTVTPLPGARRVALSPDGKTLLVFTNDADLFWMIDTTVAPPAPKMIDTSMISQLSRPYAAFFSADNATAYLLNCASGCGGSSDPSVLPVNVASLATSTPTAGTPITVGGATVGAMDGTKLYVAGNGPDPSAAPGTLAPWFTSVDLSAGTAAASLRIGDGFHNLMAKSQDNKVWIGALDCVNTSIGCLSVVDLASNTVTNGTPQGAVTGLAEVPSRHLMYVMEGGKLHNYDTGTIQFTQVLTVSGSGYDIKLIDPDQ